jgi:hypothetical protein
MNQVTVLRVVVASPGDVQAERDTLSSVADELNRTVARAHNLRLEVVRWETDAYPGFHVNGPQGLIDPILRIEDSDIFIGIFWKRFGTPVRYAGSGTEHEFRRAYETWQEQGSPHIMFYFSQKPYTPTSVEDIEQWGRVLRFQQEFPPEGLWWRYNNELEFERFVREHLIMFLLEKVKEENEAEEETEDSDEEDDDEELDSIHEDDATLEGGLHIPYPCELEEGDKINVDLRSDEPLDVIILDEEDYQSWLQTGQVGSYYGHYENREQLHAFFTAPEDGEYLVVVCNLSRAKADMQVNISHAD